MFQILAANKQNFSCKDFVDYCIFWHLFTNYSHVSDGCLDLTETVVILLKLHNIDSQMQMKKFLMSYPLDSKSQALVFGPERLTFRFYNTFCFLKNNQLLHFQKISWPQKLFIVAKIWVLEIQTFIICIIFRKIHF